MRFVLLLLPFFFILSFSSISLSQLIVYYINIYNCSHYYVIITLISMFTVLSYQDEIAVRRRTSRKDYFSILVLPQFGRF